MVLVVAERFGCSPEEVERWDEYWYTRAVEKVNGEALGAKPKTPARPPRKPRMK